MKIPYINLNLQWRDEKKELLKIINKTMASGEWVGGENISKFEKNICNFLKVKYCVALNSGTDALTLALSLIKIKRGDEIITPPNSFIASTAAIAHLGAIPIFADIKYDQNIDPEDIEKKITKNTKAIMPVHLSGRPCEMDKILALSKKYKIPIIEDAAQAIGTKYKDKFVGTFGTLGCFSAHPFKNLNAIGDSGYLVTNNSKLAKKARLLRNHGIEGKNNIKTFGFVSRMDNLQAVVLNERIKKLKKIINSRRKNAKLYFHYLDGLKYIKLPKEEKSEFNTYHTFVVQAKKRDQLKSYLEKKGISTVIHYRSLIFEHLAFKKRFKKININKFPVSKSIQSLILSLPINPFLTKRQIIKICKEIKRFYKC